MDRQHLLDVVSRLPKLNLPALVEQQWDASFTAKVAPVDGYVWPDLMFDAAYEDAAVLLVTAPGAMGKSAAARMVAATAGAPLVDLAKLPVGSDSLTGMLTRVLGWSQAPALIRELREGNGCLVLDSLDEAQLGAGREHFLAFLENVAALARDGNPRGKILVFGRREAIETAYVELGVLDVPSVIATISPLSLTQSGELVESTLDRLVVDGKPYTVHRTHPVPSAKLRLTIFEDVADALGVNGRPLSDHWAEVEDFLGYPPVLLVLSRRMAVDNPGEDEAQVRIRMSASKLRSQRGELLREVVEGILDREKTKVQDQLSRLLKLGPETAAVLYNREEQCLRLIDLISGGGLNVIPPAVLSPEDRVQYEQQIATFLQDHPFLRDQVLANVVFGDYLRSFISSAPLREIHGVGRDELIASCPAPGPFFAFFMHAMSDKQDSNFAGVSRRMAVLKNEEFIDDLIKSHMASVEGDGGSSVYIASLRDELPVLMLLDATDEGGANDDAVLSFVLTSPDGILELSSPISYTTVVSNYGAVLSAVNGNLELGPGAVIYTNDLEIHASQINVQGLPDRAGAVLVSFSSISHDARVRVNSYPPDALKVFWKDPFHQWKPFLLPGLMTNGLPSAVSWQVMLGLRRLLVVFRSSAGDNDPSIYWERVDRFVVGRNRIYQAVLDGLLQEGVIARRGDFYRLNLEKLASYNVNWVSLAGANFSVSLAALHAVICKTDAVLREADRFRSEGP